MVVFPNCKINLGLHVLNKRADGFHTIETIFYPIPFKDSLEIIRATDKQKEAIVFSQSGINIDGDAENNICVKAFRLLKKDFPQLPSVQMHLHKAIPIGAGLGGGSADGAFTLQLLNKKFQLNLSSVQLANYAAILGSDCPFFTWNRPCYATGRGEILEPLDVSLAGYHLLLVNPGILIHTGRAYNGLLKDETAKSASATALKEIILQPLQQWRDKLVNDFELPVFNLHPELSKLKKELYAHGAIYAAMSGSGSTMYAIFDRPGIPEIEFPAHYLIRRLLL